MKIHEYQAKELFREYTVPVPKGRFAQSATEAASAAAEVGGTAVVKAQVHAGGRGKAGGVKVVRSPEEAQDFAEKILGTRLVTHQTGPEGVPVAGVIVEEAIVIAKEFYASITVDPAERSAVLIVSEEGGMDIEEVAATAPDKIVHIPIDPVIGFQPYMGRRAAAALDLPKSLVRPAGNLFGNLYNMFESLDCTLIEINPLVITSDNRLLAADAKMDFDDDALARHPSVSGLRDTGQEDPLDVEAHEHDVNYIRLDGDVGCMVNGAGLAMATMDIIKYMGAQPANFLDVGGGANEEKVASAFRILLADPKVKRVLVNIFGGILRCDIAANGIVNAVKEKGIDVPLVIRMRGTNADEGKEILAKSGLSVTIADDLQEAAKQAVEAR